MVPMPRRVPSRLSRLGLCSTTIALLLGGGGCGAPSPLPPQRVVWQAEAVVPPVALWPSAGGRRRETFALPTVTWTGREPPASAPSATVFHDTVVLDQDGVVRVGEYEVHLRAPDTEHALRELRRWWRDAAADAPLDRGGRVALLLHREASWDDVRALLCFLAGPPHRLGEVQMVAARSEEIVVLPVVLGVPRREVQPPMEVSVQEDDPSTLAWARGLPELPPPRPTRTREPGASGWSPCGWLEPRSMPGGGLALPVCGHEVAPALPLDDSDVVRQANAAWPADPALELARLRFLPAARLVVWWCPSGRDTAWSKARDLHVPAAYVVQAIDLFHALGTDAEEDQIQPLRARWPAPERLRDRPPAAPLSTTMVATLALAVLAGFVVVFAGGRRRPRARA